MKPKFTVSHGRWSYRVNGLGIDNVSLSIVCDGTLLLSGPGAGPVRRRKRADRETWSWETPLGKIVLAAEVAVFSDHLEIAAWIRNQSAGPVTLGRCGLLDTAGGGAVRLGPHPGAALFFSTSGCCGPNTISRVQDAKAGLLSKTIGQLYHPESGWCLNTSFLTFDRANTEIRLAADQPDPFRHYQAVCDFDGYELQPGRSVAAETLYVALDTDPCRALERWADAVARHYRPRLWPRPPAGWVGYSWSWGAGGRRERDVINNARAIRRRLRGFDIEFIWVSILNLEKGLPGNWLKVDRRNFRRGLVPFVADLKKLGFKLGLWIAPFWVCPEIEEQLAENRDNLLRLADGSLLINHKRWPYGEAAKRPPKERPNFYCLDGSHPRTIRYLTRIFRAYRALGIRYYMLDFLNAGSGSTPGQCRYDLYYDRRMIKGPEVYRNAMRAIRRAAGEDTYLLTSTGPTLQNVGLVHAVRTGVDYGEGRAVNAGTWFYPATIALGQGENMNYMAALQNLASSWFLHGKLFFTDAGNVLTIDKPMPLSLAQISATIFAICGGPMMLGDDIDRMDPERLALLKKCLPRLPVIGRPMDLFSSAASGDRPRSFRLDCAGACGVYRIVAIFNDRPEALTRSFAAVELGLNPAVPHQVYNFWPERYDGVQQDRFTFTAPPESVGLYRIQPRLDHPWLLTTDMHLLQGQAEIAEMAWDPRRLTLAGTARRPAGETGNLLVIAPAGWKPVSYEGLGVIKYAATQEIVIRKVLRFQSDRAAWQIAFERYEI